MLSSRYLSLLSLLILSTAGLSAPALTLSPAEAETQKCEEKIASVRRDVFGKYDDQLNELLVTLEKAADLEGSLAVRSERQRLATEQDLNETNLVTEPKGLRTLQTQTLARLTELTGQLVGDTVPRLIELKKQLTIAGKLDEAINVRSAIERLQNSHLPITKADSTVAVPVDALLQAYAGDRARADKIYKGQKVTVHGVLGGYRPDPADVKTYQLYLTGGTNAGWVQCSFSGPDARFREEKGSFGAVSLVMSNRDGDIVARMQKGQALDIRGKCEGFDDVIRLDKCDQIK